MQKYIFCSAAFLLIGTAVFGQAPVRTIGYGVPVASIINTTANIPNVSTTVTLTVPCTKLTIINNSTGATLLYVDLAGGTATSTDLTIGPGAGFTYDGPEISAFKILGSAAADTYSVVAH